MGSVDDSHELASPGPDSRPAWRLSVRTLIALAVMAPLAIAAFIGTRDAARRDAAAARAQRADQAAAALQATLIRASADVHSLAGIFSTAREVDAFAQFAAPGRGSPGVVALAWAPRVPPAMRKAFEQTSGFPIARLGPNGFAIPAPATGETFPILFITPGARNTQLVGIDIASNEAIGEALRRVAAKGGEQSTPPILLPQGGSGIVLVEGAYQRGATIGSAAERTAALNGYTVGIYRLDQLGAAAFARLDDAGIEVRDGSAVAFQRGDSTGGTARSITFGGRSWTVLVQSSVGVTSSALPWVVLAGALLLALLIAAMFEQSSRRLAFSERLVALRTVELRDALGQLTVANRELDDARAAAERASQVDALTGTYNRGHLVDLVRVELNRSARGGTTPGILLVEVDEYKAIECADGADAADAVLVEVAARLATVVRNYDALGRWSTSQFGILAPNAPTDHALLRLAEALRHVVRAAPIVADGNELWVTVSIGATRPGTDAAAFTVFAAADEALAEARRAGRDCAQVAGGEGDLEPGEPDSMRVASAYTMCVAAREGTPDGHDRQVAQLAEAIARDLGLDDSEVEHARIAGLLHDVGKVALPRELLAKDAPFDDADWVAMRLHSALGAAIVARLPSLLEAADGIRHHHEWIDGSGYPQGLAGDAIPTIARIVGVADAYVAMTAGPAFRTPLTARAALKEVRAGAGTQFDPACVDALERALAVERAA